MDRRAARIDVAARPGWRRCWLVPALLCAAFGAAHAGDLDAQPRRSEIWMAVGDHTLDDMRGGFDLGSGLIVSLGITRAVYVNGELMTQTTLDFGNLANLTPLQATQLNDQLRTLNLVQTGPGNTVDPSVNAGAGGTIIQNTLNNQRISNQTVLNASTNAMSTMKGLNSMSTLSDSLLRSVGGAGR
jgi:hypothetical protein